jgi:hypothetical protein
MKRPRPKAPKTAEGPLKKGWARLYAPAQFPLFSTERRPK